MQETHKPFRFLQRLRVAEQEWTFGRTPTGSRFRRNPAWERWAEGVGLDLNRLAKPVVRFADSAVLITATIDGQGVALTRRLLVEDDLAAGRLVRLDNSVTEPERSLYFVCRLDDQHRVPIHLFSTWLFSLGS